MNGIIQLILMLIICCPNHELNRDSELREEVAGHFEAAGMEYDLPPTLLVFWAYKESSLNYKSVGKIPNKHGKVLNERGYAQVHGIARRTCEDGGYDPTTRSGGVFCIAMLINEGRRFCGSLEKGLV